MHGLPLKRESLWFEASTSRIEWGTYLILSDNLDCKSTALDVIALWSKKQSATCYLCMYMLMTFYSDPRTNNSLVNWWRKSTSNSKLITSVSCVILVDCLFLVIETKGLCIWVNQWSLKTFGNVQHERCKGEKHSNASSTWEHMW